MNLTVSRIALVKPEKARGVEDVLLRAAQTGGISEKVIDNARSFCGFVYPLLVLQELDRADIYNCYTFLVSGVRRKAHLTSGAN
jgi:hypothetical protein